VFLTITASKDSKEMPVLAIPVKARSKRKLHPGWRLAVSVRPKRVNRA
jgi:hypothetical protein